VANGFKNLVAVALETGYMFKQAEPLKNRVENPEAFAAVTTVASTTATTTAPKVEDKKPEPEPVVEEEEEVGDLADFF
jgi:large subunit ribosomal protein LP0